MEIMVAELYIDRFGGVHFNLLDESGEYEENSFTNEFVKMPNLANHFESIPKEITVMKDNNGTIKAVVGFSFKPIGKYLNNVKINMVNKIKEYMNQELRIARKSYDCVMNSLTKFQEGVIHE